MQSLGKLSLVCVAFAACRVHASDLFTRAGNFSNQVEFLDPASFAVLDTFRPPSANFNPTNHSIPFFQVFDREFLDILGPNPSLTEIASSDIWFAHEAPIYNAGTNEVFFCTFQGAPGGAGIDRNNRILKINLGDIEAALANGTQGPVNVTYETLDIPEEVQMTNGGSGPFHGDLLFVTQGRGDRPPSVVLVNPKPPYNVTVLLNNFFGRQFNSINDVKIHPSGNILFTDATYGSIGGIRPAPLLPVQVYRLDPKTRAVTVVASDFQQTNGIALSEDGKTAYVGDSGSLSGRPGTETSPSTIYAFDVDPVSQAFLNRRVFAYVDSGIPDGIQVDPKGNVYTGANDGVHVWNSKGKLLGKMFNNLFTANLVFAGDGRVLIFSETKLFLAKIAAKAPTLVYPRPRGRK